MAGGMRIDPFGGVLWAAETDAPDADRPHCNAVRTLRVGWESLVNRKIQTGNDEPHEDYRLWWKNKRSNSVWPYWVIALPTLLFSIQR